MDLSVHRNLIVGIVVGLVLGLLLGMLLFWGLFPVEWTDAQPYDLSPEAKADYVALLADSFALDKDPARAEQYMELWETEEREQAVADALAQYESEGQVARVLIVQDMAMALGISLPEEATTILPETPAPPEMESPLASIWDRFRVPCLVFVLVLLALVLVAIAVRTLLGRRGQAEGPAAGVPPAPAAVRAGRGVGLAGAPLGQFFTTYQLGEDTYDESFSIESPSGEFLGECGMGISETIGDGEPDKVTAFEVWLFDKSDIRTVTKVLMSRHAFYDDALRAKLAPKGEAVLAQPGSPLVLDTSSLRIQVNVTDLAYGEEELPAESFFTRLTVEMVATVKPAEADTI